MLQFIHKKLKNQKLLNGCLFLGLVILMAVMSLTVMFERGALDDVIRYDFENYAIEKSEYPAVISTHDKYEIKDVFDLKGINSVIDGNTSKWNRYFDIPVLSTEKIFTISAGRMVPDLVGNEGNVTISTFNEMDTRLELTDIDTGFKEGSGVLPCYMSKFMMDEKCLTIGETLEFTFMTDAKEEPLKLRIIGIAEEKHSGDYYWFNNLRKNSNNLIVTNDIFDKLLTDYEVSDINMRVYEMLDYRAINSSNVRATKSYLTQFQSIDKNFKTNFEEIVDNYMETEKQVKLTVLSILFPLFVILLIFIYMVSDRIRMAEELDINVLRSRGIPRLTIIKQYVFQSLMITAAAVIPGIILGYIMCKVGASSVDFLSFKWKVNPSYTLRPEILISIAAAFPIAVTLNVIPIINASGNTILTNRGKANGKTGNSFIERFFIDIILLIISVYLLYNYTRQRDVMVSEILAGKVADPMCLIDAELFTFGAAFFLIRISRLIITAIYKAGKRKWKPDTLAAFLEIIRTRRKSWVISVFLIITIAMGIYNANLAKTINRNKRERLVNDIGTELVLTPASRMVAEDKERGGGWSLIGLDYSDFVKMKDDGLVDNMTRVYETEKLTVTTSKGTAKNILLMGVDTKELGETATFDVRLNKRHWFYELNELAVMYNGAIISQNMADAYKVKVGDSIELKLESPFEDEKDLVAKKMNVQVVGIVDAFPGYNRYYYKEDEVKGIIENERYLVVVNSAALNISYGELPPDIWMDLKAGKTLKDIENYLETNEMEYNRLTGLGEELDKVFGSAMLLITNGLFNISFIVSMVICMIGFLIYWLTSIRSRQMYFGVYRAMGMGMKALSRMLIKEHIFSTVTSLISSVIVGAVTSILFIKLISCIYLPDRHTIPLRVFVSFSGYARIGIMMAAVIVLCMYIIISYIKKINISEAIKMGEE